MTTFPRLHPRLRDKIVSELGWASLRPVQEEADSALLDGASADASWRSMAMHRSSARLPSPTQHAAAPKAANDRMDAARQRGGSRNCLGDGVLFVRESSLAKADLHVDGAVRHDPMRVHHDEGRGSQRRPHPLMFGRSALSQSSAVTCS